MDMAESFLFDAGWIFFAAWGMILAAIGVIAFGREFLERDSSEVEEAGPQIHP